jgi:hypothetical protein
MGRWEGGRGGEEVAGSRSWRREVREVVMRRPGPYALEREGGSGGGVVVGCRDGR